MKSTKKVIRSLSIAIIMLLVVGFTTKPLCFCSAESEERLSINKFISDNRFDSSTRFIDFLREVDKFVMVEKNRFVLNETLELKNLIANYSNKNNLKYDELYALVINRLNDVNRDIENKHKFITEHKNIKETVVRGWNYSLGHEVQRKWWGARHILRTQYQVNDYVYKLRVASVGTGAAMLIPGAQILAGLTTAYLNLVALDIEHYAQNNGVPFNFDVAWTLNYNFTEVG